MIIGLVGKPSSGKSTTFKALTLAEVPIAPYPFTTIGKNEGVAYVKVDCADTFFNTQCNPREGYCLNHKRFIPVRLIDVAGLVPEAHKGKGLGLQFLDDLRQADVLIHVVDASGGLNERGEPVDPGSHDVCKDVEFLEIELDMWYLSILKKGWEKFARGVQLQNKNVAISIATQLSGLNVSEDMANDAIRKVGLSSGKPATWTEDQLLRLAVELRRQTKPILIAANKMDLPSSHDNYLKLKEKFPHLTIVPCAADLELALREAAKKELIDYIPGENDFTIRGKVSEKQEKASQYIKDNIFSKYESTGVQNILDTAIFEVLKYITIFPGGMNNLADKHGNVLPDAFLLPEGSTALEFAFKIHTDLGKGFIKAFDVKKKLVIGKDHVLNHLDVIEIVSR
ncbi:redox-regulated ATPase YchF [Nanoarchaeota archaeon]